MPFIKKRHFFIRITSYNVCYTKLLRIISCGYDNSFNHPSVNSVSRLNEYTNMVLRTDLLGTIVVEVEDNTLNIKSKKGDSYVVNR